MDLCWEIPFQLGLFFFFSSVLWVLEGRLFPFSKAYGIINCYYFNCLIRLFLVILHGVILLGSYNITNSLLQLISQ